MGKALIIKNANFQANALGQIERSVSGGFTAIQSSSFLTTSKNKIGRYMDYNSSTSAKRLTLLNKEGGLLYVPKGATLTIRGLSDLCLDFACFDRDHDYRDWRMISNGTGYQDGVLTDFSGKEEGTLTYAYLITTGYQENNNTAYAVHDGLTDFFTMVNNFDGEWFQFLVKNAENTSIDPSDVNISYEVTLL